jgi:hypothetical protein
MSMKKFVSLMFALAFVFTMACGKGHEAASKEQEGEDDEAGQTTTAATASNANGAPASTAPAAAAPAVADAATLAGTIKFAGAAPKPAPIQMSADPYCQSQHPNGQGAEDEEVVVGPAGELANVLVYVKNAPNGPVPTTPALLDQKGCRYYPHVNAVMVNQPLQIRNSDSTLHNVHAMPETNSQFNVGQPVQGMVADKKFDKPEMKPFRIKCDVHGWMKSYMAVMPNPYFSVSKMDGQFSIPNLPPGNYTVVAWHEKYGQQEQQVTVGPKESKQISFSFKG